MAAAESIEHACADVWPAVTERALGDWRLRAADGFTGRANSALATGAPDRPLRSALEEVARFYGERGLPPKLQVIGGDPIEPGLRAAGWHPDESHCGPDGIAVLLGPLHAPGSEGVVHAEPDPRWWPLVVEARTPTRAQRHVLTGYRPAGYGLLERGGEPAAAVRGAVHGELLHVARLAVAPAWRRRGLATGMLGALYRWAGGHGARCCVLQVDAANDAALRLYARLGCVEHHRYRYWRPPR